LTAFLTQLLDTLIGTKLQFASATLPAFLLTWSRSGCQDPPSGTPEEPPNESERYVDPLQSILGRPAASGTSLRPLSATNRTLHSARPPFRTREYPCKSADFEKPNQTTRARRTRRICLPGSYGFHSTMALTLSPRGRITVPCSLVYILLENAKSSTDRPCPGRRFRPSPAGSAYCFQNKRSGSGIRRFSQRIQKASIGTGCSKISNDQL